MKNFGVKKIKNLGNLKFSNPNFSSSDKLSKNISKVFKHKKVWCAASTHHNEEIFCGKTHFELKKKLKNSILIIIPRHVNRCDEIIDELNKINLKVHLHSAKSKFTSNKDIYLVDTYGETQKFFGISRAVFLGKSIFARGGQNPIEPARMGCKIYHGPYVSNFKEVYYYLNFVKISKKINNIQKLKGFLLNDFNSRVNVSKKFKKKINSLGQSMLKNIYLEIRNFL